MWAFPRGPDVAQTDFGVLPGEVGPYVAADSVCLWEAVSLGCSYITGLNWNLPRGRNGFV